MVQAESKNYAAVHSIQNSRLRGRKRRKSKPLGDFWRRIKTELKRYVVACFKCRHCKWESRLLAMNITLRERWVWRAADNLFLRLTFKFYVKQPIPQSQRHLSQFCRLPQTRFSLSSVQSLYHCTWEVELTSYHQVPSNGLYPHEIIQRRFVPLCVFSGSEFPKKK